MNDPPIGPVSTDWPSSIGLFCTIAGIVEFLAYLPTVPVVLLCLFLTRQTCILHPNLKRILLALCANVFLFAVFRLSSLGIKFIEGNIFWFPPPIVIAANGFCIFFGNLVGHVLMAERILATIYVDQYENFDRPRLTLGSLGITVLTSALLCCYQFVFLASLLDPSDFMYFANVVAMAASFVEVFLISLITYLNGKWFKQRHGQLHTNRALSIRYQLTENIRTGRQLAPLFSCHFVGVVVSFVIVLNNRHRFISSVGDILLLNAVGFVVHSINNLVMPLSLITRHPKLNAQARKLLLRIAGKIRPNKVHNGGVQIQMDLDVCALPSELWKSDKGGARSAEVNTYFDQLLSAWGDLKAA